MIEGRIEQEKIKEDKKNRKNKKKLSISRFLLRISLIVDLCHDRTVVFAGFLCIISLEKSN